MGDSNTDTMDAAHQVIVLAFDLADAEVGQLPNQLKDALTSPPVQKAIRKTLLDFAQSKGQDGNYRRDRRRNQEVVVRPGR